MWISAQTYDLIITDSIKNSQNDSAVLTNYSFYPSEHVIGFLCMHWKKLEVEKIELT